MGSTSQKENNNNDERGDCTLEIGGKRSSFGEEVDEEGHNYEHFD